MSDLDYDNENVNMKAAIALLIVSDAIVISKEGENKLDVVERIANCNNLDFQKIISTFQTLIEDLKYFSVSGASSKWSAGFADVFNRTHTLRIEQIEGTLKARVRGKFSCSLCGQLEKNCHFVVHFAGSNEHGQQTPPYSTKDFATSDPEKLSIAYSKYANCYNSAYEILCEESERQWPAPAYLGLVVPGETCMKHLFTAFNASNLARSVIDEAFENHRLQTTNMTLDMNRVKKLSSTIAHIRESASGTKRPFLESEDTEFWDDLSSRFTQQQQIDEFSRLHNGFIRMESNINTPDSEEDSESHSDEDSEAPRRIPRKKRNVVEDSESSEDDEPLAKRPIHTHNTRSARLNPCEDEDTEEDPISAALDNVNSKTASKLRKPGLDLIGSRRSTIKNLSQIVLEILNDGDISLASLLLKALSKLTEALVTRERGSDYSDIYKKTTLQDLNTLLYRVRSTLITQGHVTQAREVSEGIIVSYELLA